MMENRAGSGLLQFLPESAETMRILVVNATELLPAIAEKLPQAELWVVEEAAEKMAAFDLPEADLRWYSFDFTAEALPFAAERFDYILADRCLEQMRNPQDFAFALFFWLKETGHLLTSFTNVRHWSILQELMQGHFRGNVCHFFALPEIEQLLQLSFYKKTAFVPIMDAAPPGLIEKLEDCGFCNPDGDLRTKIWLVQASRSNDKTAFLKRSFSKSVRAELACRLRRIAYDVEREGNCRAFWEFCDGQQIPFPYIAAFVENTAVEPWGLLMILVLWAAEHGRQQAAEALLEEGALLCRPSAKALFYLRQQLGGKENERR